ncbi:MAG: SLC5 family protein [Pirellulales bacterium]
MNSALTPLDGAIFVVSLLAVMAVGLVAGRRETTAADYFLAGRTIPWWGVAGSIFGSNVSANHMVGMMGIGFTVGFAQSHFELGAIAGLMVLCYGFLPVYRRLNLYTLSDYLRQRYDERSAALYAVFMLIVMVLVQMVNGFYIGSRSLNVLFATGEVAATADDPRAEGASGDRLSGAATAGGDSSDRAVDGPSDHREVRRAQIPFHYYALGVLALVVVSGTYTIIGGLKAVVWTDVMQSVLILIAGLAVAVLVFAQPEIRGWAGMRRIDAQEQEITVEIEGPPQVLRIGGERKMRLYLPSDHAELPWTGVLTGLMIMHVYYWGTNQFIVQRALAARSDAEARRGIVVAGFLKMLIPFFAIGSGIAAYYLFQQRMPGVTIDSDAAFTEVVKLVVPRGIGLMGLIATGLIGAILSSVDSMMNSAATIVTFDLYKRYVNPEADEKRLIWIGRLSILVFVTVAALVAILVLDPNSTKHFFLQIIDQQTYLVPGLVVVFFLGMLWRGATATAAFVTILLGPLFSLLLHFGYQAAVASHVLADGHIAADAPALFQTFGPQLNMFHRVTGTVLFCIGAQIALSMVTQRDATKSRLTWTELGGHDRHALRRMLGRTLGALALYAVLAGAMVRGVVNPLGAAVLAAAWTVGLGIRYAAQAASGRHEQADAETPRRGPLVALLAEDRFWAGLLCGLAVFMLFYFYS